MRNIRLIWRYSHLCLALTSGIFIAAAAITGAILCLDPALKMLDKSNTEHISRLKISDVLISLDKKYEEVLYIELDPNNRIIAAIIDFDNEINGDFYINPHNGEIISTTKDQTAFFQFVTNFHRSLFLKSTGRAIIGLTSLFLILILVSGLLLLISRQGSVKAVFLPFKKDSKLTYTHISLSRWFVIPIFIVASTGIYLSLDRFQLIPEGTNSVKQFDIVNSTLNKPAPDFDVFQNYSLKQLRKLEFPFSSSDDDYFRLSLKQREFLINQYTGQVIKETSLATTTKWHMLSFTLHTGSGNLIWDIILFLTAIVILILLYSGIRIAIKRNKKSKTKDVNLDQFEYIILVGSESGITYDFADMLKAAFGKQNITVGIGEMNDYKAFANLKYLFILSSTYGEGDAPSSASKFLNSLDTIKQPNSFRYSIVGFGSLAYQHFCGFAKKTAEAMKEVEGASQILDPFYIHNQSIPDFIKWGNQLSSVLKIPLQLTKSEKEDDREIHRFRLSHKSTVRDYYDETFMLTLDTPQDLSFNNGDLLSIKPPNENLARQYSIGSNIDGQILLSIKKHEHGICSNYLNELNQGESIQASLDINSSFHFPPVSPYVILIANGTGMAPFVGMIHQNNKQIPVSLYWGGRTKKAFSLYQSQIQQAQNEGKVQTLRLAFSRESEMDKCYVQDLIAQDIESIIQMLKAKGVIMICGSVSMQKGVLEVIEKGCLDYQAEPLNHYIKMKKIRMDCY